jgi:hypothetical protein
VTEVTLLNLTTPTGVKIAILISIEALFGPIAAQAEESTTYASSVTLSLGSICLADTSTVTSVQAKSVLLILDTATVAIDTADYHYYTETNTALWGASYDYGQKQNLDCTYSNLMGTMTLTRGPFIASIPGYSETSAAGSADFVQYVGNLNLSGTTYSFTNNCGNTTVPNLNVANPCDFQDPNKQGDWPVVSLGSSQIVRTGVRSGIPLPATGVHTTSGHAATIFIVTKVKKSVVAAAPANTQWISSETFTVTSV